MRDFKGMFAYFGRISLRRALSPQDLGMSRHGGIGDGVRLNDYA
jgi:hypothetical protein